MIPRPDPEDRVRMPGAGASDDAARDPRLEWFDVAFETSSVAMSVISIFEVRVVRVNAAMARLYGMSVEEVLSADPFKLALKITHPDDLVAEQKLFAELAVGARRSYRLDKRYVRPDGSIRWGDLTFSAIHDGPMDPSASVGPMRFAVLLVVDITERKLLEETLARREDELRHAQKIDGIGRLAAGVAHDFNNLLTIITGHGEMLKRRIADGARATSEANVLADVDAILSASDRAASLTAQLLAHGRREAAMPRAIVLSDAVATLQRLLSRTIESSIEVEQSLTASGAIFADEGQIGQVVMNLVLNARDAMAGGGRIALSTRDVVVQGDARDGTTPGPGEWVVLVVSDGGHGMSPEVRARMFEPFFTTRADRPGTQGTGLGLATVQRIVAESRGFIEVESTPGQGTTVSVYFPRVPNTPMGVEGARPSVAIAQALNSQRVLVVEDEPAVRSLIATVLLGAHYRVMVAHHAEEGLRLIEAEREPFQLIVTDLVMPGIGGVSLATRLRDAGSDARFLFISGYSTHALSGLLHRGHFLAKPFTPTQLLAAVSRALEP
jgi:two-component system, cell cycle sensor histidine kinase and response regulator CckA